MLGAVSAGVMSYASGMIDTAMGLEGVPVKDMSYVQQFERGAVNAVVKSGVDSALYGTDFGESLRMGLATEVSNMGFRFVGDTSMYQAYTEGNPLFEDGGLGKTALHGLVGAGSAALMGGDAAAGAASAAANEFLGFVSKDLNHEGQLAVSGVIGAVAGGVVAGEDGVAMGQTIARSATEYNRQLHVDEIKFIEETIGDFKFNHKKTTLTGIEYDYDDNEVQRLLISAAKYMVNEDSQTEYNENAKYVSANEFSRDELQSAINYLKSTSEGLTFVDAHKEMMTPQAFFTATSEQFRDSAYTPDITKGLEDYSYMFAPMVPVAGNSARVLGTIGKEATTIADDLYLTAGIKANNFMQNKLVPTLENGYYKSMNFIYTRPSELMMGADIVYGAISPEPPVTGSQLLGNRIKAWAVDPLLEQMEK